MNICFKENGRTYLAYISYMGIDEVAKDVERINTEKPERLPTGGLAHCDKRVYFVDTHSDCATCKYFNECNLHVSNCGK